MCAVGAAVKRMSNGNKTHGRRFDAKARNRSELKAVLACRLNVGATGSGSYSSLFPFR